jgi:serine/threonine-protein kinase
MTPEKWEKVKAIFQSAMEMPTGDRASYAVAQCGEDESLLFEVGSLLQSQTESAELFETPAFKAMSDMVDDSPDESRVGQSVGSYKIEKEIGRGGMATVYLATRADEAFEKKVAVKLIKRGLDTDEIVSRFRHERQILAGLDHPNITRLLDGGSTEDGLPYLVMDHVDGLPVKEYCDENRLSIKQRLQLFLDVCSAIAYAHKNLIVHRDLKPSNILVTSDGLPKILDFGIAKLMAENGGSTTLNKTINAFRAMTPEYASPEQINGRQVTTSSDIYSLGVVLYELLTGHRPFRFRSKNVEEMGRVMTDTSPSKPSSACRTRGVNIAVQYPDAIARMLRGDLDNIVLMALRREPERRYSSVEQFAADIERYLSDMPVIAREDTFSYRATKFVTRNKAGVAAGIGIAASLIGGLVAVSRQRDRARQEALKAKRVNRFLQKMLASADPRESGRELRVGDMLRVAAESVEGDFALEPEIMGDLNSTIGLTYLSLGQMEEAEKYLKSALETRRRYFPSSSIEVATSENNYGRLLMAKGDLNAAEKLFLRSLDTFDSTGLHGLEVAEVLKDIGYLTALKGNNERAIKFHEEELDIRRKVQGNEHPDFARALVRLANVHSLRGDTELSEKLHRRALRIFRAVYGNAHPDVAMTMSNLVRDVMYSRPSEAEQLSIEALDMRRQILGDDHPDVAWSKYNLAYVLLERGETEQADDMLKEAFAMRGPNLPDGHPVVSSSFLLLGRILMARGLNEDAREAFEKCLELRLATLPHDHWLVATTRSFLGQCLVRLGHSAVGEDLLRDSHHQLVDKLGRNHEQTRQAEERLRNIL